MDTDLAALREGDPEALERVARALWSIAFRTALAVLSGRDAAEDVAQEAVVAVLGSVGRLRAAEALESYTRRTAARCAYRELRRVGRESPAGLPYPGEPTWILEEYMDLRRAVAELPDEDRIPLLLHYGAGMTSMEIGGALTISPPTVRFRLMRARRRLREAISAEMKGDLPHAAT